MMFLVNYVLMTMMMTSIRCNAKFTLTYRWWARIHGWFWDPKTSLFLFLTEAECPSYTAVHHRQSGLPCCCCPYLEQSAPTCHVRIFYVCFPKSLQHFSLQAFIPVTFTATAIVPVQWQLSFSDTNRSVLLTYLPTYLLMQWYKDPTSKMMRVDPSSIVIAIYLNHLLKVLLVAVHLLHSLVARNWIKHIINGKLTSTIDQELTGAAAYAHGGHFVFIHQVAAQHFPVWNDVTAATLRLWHQIKNLTVS